jgi:uncharacterized protein (DUF433 family)
MTKPDRRNLPAYSPQEAARYLGVPLSMILCWTATPAGEAEPIIVAAGRNPLSLSFYNLVEIHVLGSTRRQRKVPVLKVRNAMDFFRGRLRMPRPLITAWFATSGIDLFVEYCGQCLNATPAGQQEIRDVLQESLRWIDRDPVGLPVRLYPFTRNQRADAPRLVVIDPDRSFGRPVISGTGLVTAEIAARFKAGESFDELAADYRLSANRVAEAVRCEL